jgi:hypothetical protein
MITDKSGVTSIAQVTITVLETATPTAVADAVTVVEDSGVTSIDVLANDSFGSDGPAGTDSLTLSSSFSAGGGTIAVNAGKVDYTPLAVFSGEDTFDYTIKDLTGDESTVTVTVTVDDAAAVGTSDEPTAKDDAVSFIQDSVDNVISILLDNGSGADSYGSDGPSATHPISLLGVYTLNGAKIDLVGTTVTYTPRVGFSGEDTFNYMITNAKGIASRATVTVTVTVTAASGGSSNVPTAKDDVVTFIKNSTGNVINILLDNGSGADSYGSDGPNATHPISLSGTYTGNGGKIDIVGTTVVYTPKVDFVGVDAFSYRITDLNGDASLAQVTVNVAVAKTSVNGDENDNTLIKELQVYPNPSRGNFNLQIYTQIAEQASIVLFDVTGKVIYNTKQLLSVGNNTMNLDVKVKAGIMFLKVYSSNTNFGTKKIVFE